MKLSQHPIFPLLDEIAGLLEWKSGAELEMRTVTRILDFAEVRGWKNDLDGLRRLILLKKEQPGFADWIREYPICA